MSYTDETAQIVAAQIAKSNLTVTAVANKTGISRTTLNRKINEGAPFNTIELIRIADALGIEAHKLLPAELKPASVKIPA